MARVRSVLRTKDILRGQLKMRGLTAEEVARSLRMPRTTLDYKIRNLDNLLQTFREIVNLAKLTDDEIIQLIRGKEL